MLTQQEIDEVRAATGDAPLRPTAPNSVQRKPLAEILGLRTPQKPVTPTPVVPASQFATDLAGTYKNAPTDFAKEAGRNDESTSKNAVVRTAENALGATASGINTVFAPITHAVKGVADSIAQGAKDPLDQSKALYDNPVVSKILDFFGGASGKLEEFEKAHPEAARNLSNALTVGLTAAGGESKLADKPVGSLEGIKTGVKDVGSDLLDTGKAVGEKVVDTASNVKDKLSFKTKTPEDILSTPESQVHKLSSVERKFYFDHQQEAIKSEFETKKSEVKQKYTDIQDKVTEKLKSDTEASQKEAESLQREMNVSSRDEVLRLRPKIRTALSEQSAKYRDLVEEELAPVRDNPITQDDLAKFVENRFPDNPDLARTIKGKLGIEDRMLVSKNGDVMPIKDTTIGQVYDKAQSLKQDIGSSAKQGNRVYTPDEKLTDDAISTMTDYLKSQGVDLKESRQFWARYAPIRNQLVMEAKPFLQTDIKTKTFANTLTRVAKGADVNNENFIREVENLLGEPIAKDTRGAIEKLSANEKQRIASEAQAKIVNEEVKMMHENEVKALKENRTASEKALDRKKLDIERRTLRRKILRGFILAVPTAGAWELGKKAVDAATH